MRDRRKQRGVGVFFTQGYSEHATKSSFTKGTRDESDGKRLAVPRKNGELRGELRL